MKKYYKPIIINVVSEVLESVNTLSGYSQICNSSVMKGKWKSINYKLNHRGCEGCPANWNDGVCHVSFYTNDLDFRPWWEVLGLSPTF